ncbi:MAG: hypothetical protein ABFR36_01985 [Acidobacteriota bacterium]
MEPYSVQYLEGKISKVKNNFNCVKCGGDLEYNPEVSSLECPFCGEINKIEKGKKEIKEKDYEKFLEELENKEPVIEKKTSGCNSCGSVFSVEPDTISTECPYCATPVVLHDRISKFIKPAGIHPFKITAENAREKFSKWIQKRWFLPSEMKEMKFPEEKLTGIYLPYWTYDANSISYYSGERGIDKTTTKSYSVMENGENVTKSKDVKYTDWDHTSGVVYHAFNDVLIPAGKTIPDKFNELIKPWKLKNISPFKEEYLSGFRAEKYSIGVKDGFISAKEKMGDKIRGLIRKDIGGDQQKIHSVRSDFDKISFKHILLPLWMSSYRYKDKVYRFVINGVTGEVQGNRPWSKWKLLFMLTIIALIIAGLIILL